MFRILPVILFLALTAKTSADGLAAPFVAGFDRFGRHAEIEAATAGRLLISELSCTACHLSEDDELAPKRGPRLDGVADRISERWLRDYLLAPHTVKPGTTMPDVLAGVPEEKREETLDALLAFLSTQHEPWPEIKAGGGNPLLHRFWERGDADNGRRLYHNVGCVACHEPDAHFETAEVKPSPLDELLAQLDPEEIAEMGLAAMLRPVASVPLPDLRAKYTAQSLTDFLLHPDRTRPAGRMPSLKLEPFEAADIAAWLLRKETVQSSQLAPRDEAPAHSGPDGSPVDAIGKRRNVSPVHSGSVQTVAVVQAGGLAAQSVMTAAGERVEAGRKLFADLGCANCHSASENKSKPARPLAELNLTAERTCFGSAGVGGPWYPLDEAQITAVRAALVGRPLLAVQGAADDKVPIASNDRTSNGTGRSARPAEGEDDADIQFTLLQLNCYGCHERNNRGGVGRNRRPYFETSGNVDIGDEGRIPPPITGVGHKLEADWMNKVLQGTGDVRPYLLARMPQFPARAVASLPAQLAEADRTSQETAAATLTNTADLAGHGRALMDVGCVQCHAFAGESLPGVVGIDLTGVPQRIRPEWFREFLRNPTALKPRTRMPTFFPGGKSQNPDVLGGDPEEQIAAMWAYLKAGDQQPLPAKIEAVRAQDFELRPAERAIVLRTFMPEAGTHAIAVGLPAGVHFAFDAEHLRLAQAWRGRFLDAQGTWFSRFTPPAQPLGEDVITLPPGPPLAWLTDLEQPWPTGDEPNLGNRFRGYRLDDAGVPTFRYDIGAARVEDRIEADGEEGLTRRLVVTVRADSQPSDSNLWFRSDVEHSKTLSESNQSPGEKTRVTVGNDNDKEVRSRDEVREHIHPIDLSDGPATLEVNYRW